MLIFNIFYCKKIHFAISSVVLISINSVILISLNYTSRDVRLISDFSVSSLVSEWVVLRGIGNRSEYNDKSKLAKRRYSARSSINLNASVNRIFNRMKREFLCFRRQYKGFIISFRIYIFYSLKDWCCMN